MQRLVDADRAGVMFSADPSTGDRSRIVIEGAFGLGEVVVGGEVEPDTYVLAKDGPRLLEVRIGRKSHQVVPRRERGRPRRPQRRRGDGPCPRAMRRRWSWPASALRVEEHYGGEPQDIEWAIAGGETFLVQARPITTLTPHQRRRPTADAGDAAAAGPGRLVGRRRREPSAS